MAFQVLAARAIGIGEAYLILAERRTGSGYPIVESFLVVPKTQTCYRPKVFGLNRSDSNVSPEVLREIDLIRVARQTAEEELEADVVAWWRAQIPGTASRAGEVQRHRPGRDCIPVAAPGMPGQHHRNEA